MSAKRRFDGIRSLIKSYRGGRDSTFDTKYSQILTEGARAGDLSEAEVEALKDVRGLLERWFAEPTVAGDDAMGEWQRLRDRTNNYLPSAVVETLLSRLPASIAKSLDRRRLVLELADRNFLRLLVKHRLLKTSDMTRVAKDDPEAFYRSPSLDVLLENHVTAPRTIWSQLTESGDRTPGLVSGAEALAESYSVDNSADASKWFLSFLAEHPNLRSAVLSQLLRDQTAFERFVRALSDPDFGRKGKKRKQTESLIETLLPSFVGLCAQVIEEGKQSAPSARWALGLLTIAALSPAASLSPETMEVLEQASARIASPYVIDLLRSSDGKTQTKKLPVVVMSDVLHESIQSYLQHLPSGEADSGTLGRAARFQRYMGRKEVIQEVLPLLDKQNSAPPTLEELDAALFNVGLRPLGMSEGSDTFASHRHEPLTPGIVPGDQVRVVRPGWQLGDGEDAIVLRKAEVTEVD